MKAEQHIRYARRRATAPESKVARRAQLCASHWVQGSPLPPAAQAIILTEITEFEQYSLFFSPLS
jgi:hypothetical protein